jgi:hypothetical protein
MAQIGTLASGAGVQTNITGQAMLEGNLLIGSVGLANPLQSLQIEIDGVTFINIQTQALISAFAKWQSSFVNNGVGSLIKISTGRIPLRSNIRLTNSGATTPAIFNFSDNANGVPLQATTVSINAVSYQDFNNFSALFIQTPANVGTVEITFKDGHRDTLTMAEVDSYFAQSFSTDADGRLATVSVIDNSNQNVSSVRINATTAVNVLQVKLPDNFFESLKDSRALM